MNVVKRNETHLVNLIKLVNQIKFAKRVNLVKPVSERYCILTLGVSGSAESGKGKG